jgi:hypothetical protein
MDKQHKLTNNTNGSLLQNVQCGYTIYYVSVAAECVNEVTQYVGVAAECANEVTQYVGVAAECANEAGDPICENMAANGQCSATQNREQMLDVCFASCTQCANASKYNDLRSRLLSACPGQSNLATRFASQLDQLKRGCFSPIVHNRC